MTKAAAIDRDQLWTDLRTAVVVAVGLAFRLILIIITSEIAGLIDYLPQQIDMALALLIIGLYLSLPYLSSIAVSVYDWYTVSDNSRYAENLS